MENYRFLFVHAVVRLISTCTCGVSASNVTSVECHWALHTSGLYRKDRSSVISSSLERKMLIPMKRAPKTEITSFPGARRGRHGSVNFELLQTVCMAEQNAMIFQKVTNTINVAFEFSTAESTGFCLGKI